jgi:peroxiredoxin
MHRFLFLPLALSALLAARGEPEGGPQKQKPPTIASKYRALTDEYLKALKASDQVFEKAKTDAERRKVRADFQRWRTAFVGRMLAFAEAHPKDKDALSALFFTLHPDTHAGRGNLDKAVRLFMKDHTKSDRITSLPTLLLLADQDPPIGEASLRAVLKESPHRSAQAHACVGLGLLLKRRSVTSRPELATKLSAEAEELFARVVEKHSGVTAAAELAKAELFQIRHLAVGKTMPDVKGQDGDGKGLKLSDYRGKVVVVSFWATWCPACMKMVPHERSLAKRLEGKPFALLGINLDSTRENLKKAEEKHKITWRSFFDGRDGPIRKQHNLQSMPTIYVLDAKGVIRYKDVQDDAMDRAVAHLLAELEKEAKK